MGHDRIPDDFSGQRDWKPANSGLGRRRVRLDTGMGIVSVSTVCNIGTRSLCFLFDTLAFLFSVFVKLSIVLFYCAVALVQSQCRRLASVPYERPRTAIRMCVFGIKSSMHILVVPREVAIHPTGAIRGAAIPTTGSIR